MFDAERTRLAWPDLMSAHFDLQPAIAASRTAATGPLIFGFHHSGQPSGPHAWLPCRDGRLDVRRIDRLVETGMQLFVVEFALPPRHEYRGDAVAGNIG